jgi:hypothetical protein
MSERRDHPFTLRKKFSKEILESLKGKKSKRIREGEIYVLKYEIDPQIPTDKWHQIPLIFVTEVTTTTLTGYNLFYIDKTVTSRIIKEALKTSKFTGSKISFLLENELANSKRYCSVKKIFKLSRIIACSQVQREDWEKIPEMDRIMFGNLNSNQLHADWNLETKISTEKKKKKKEIEEDAKQEEFSVEEDLNAREIIFETVEENNNLRDVAREISEDDFLD